jgi:RNA polymerase primary sigma factor
MTEQINRVNRTQRQLNQELDRDPTAEEIAKRLGNGMTADKVRDIQQIALDTVSLENRPGMMTTATWVTLSRMRMR